MPKRNDEAMKMATAIGLSNISIKNSAAFLGESTLLYLLGDSLIRRQFISNEYSYFNRNDLFTNICYFNSQIGADSEDVIVSFAKSINDTPHGFYVMCLKSGDLFEISNNEEITVIQMIVDHRSMTLYVLGFRKETEEPKILAWSLIKPQSKLVGKIPLKSVASKFVLHATRSRMLILMNETSLRLIEHRPQNCNFVEKNTLLSCKENQSEVFLDILWTQSKKSKYLVVLASGNVLYLFIDDSHKKRIQLDISIVSFVKFWLNAISGNDDFLNIQQEMAGLDDEPDDEVDAARAQQILPIEGGFVLATHNFHFCICNIQLDTTISPPESIVYISQGYKLVSDNLKKQSLYYCSSNNKATLFTIIATSKEQDFPPVNGSRFMKKRNSRLKVLGINKKQTELQTQLVTTPYILNLVSMESNKSAFRDFFQTGIQNNPIKSLRASLIKGTFLSVSADDIRIYNITSELDEKQSRKIGPNYGETIMDADIHPSGLFVVLALQSCFRVLAVLEDRMTGLKEVTLNNCNLVRYTPRARYLLANSRQVINIYDGIHYNLISTFINHRHQIKSFFSLSSKNWVISTCEEKELMMWQIVDKPKPSGPLQKDTGDTLNIYRHKSTEPYNDIAYDEKMDTLICATQNSTLKVYKELCMKLALIIECKNRVTALCFDSEAQVLYLGQENGDIKTLNSASIASLLENKIKSIDETSLIKSSTRISGSAISTMQYCSKDKILLVGDVKGNIVGVGANAPEAGGEGVILVQNYKIKEQRLQARDVAHEIEQLKNASGRENQKIIKEFEAKRNAFEEKFQQNSHENELLKEKFSLNCREKIERNKELLEQTKNAADQALAQLEAEFAKLIAYEEEALEKQTVEAEKELEEIQKEADLAQKMHEERLAEVRLSLQAEVDELEAQLARFTEDSERVCKESYERIQAQEQTHEATILRETFTKQREIAFELSQYDKLKEQRQKELIDHNEASTFNQNLQRKVEEVVLENTALLEEKVKVCLSLFNMQEQLLERENVIMNKEQGLKSAIHVQKSLENFRFILEHKIQLFKDEKSKLEERIELKESSIRHLFAEMVQQSTTNTQKSQEIALAQQLLSIINGDIMAKKLKNREITEDFHNFLRKIQSVVSEEIGTIPKRKKLKSLIEEFGDIEKRFLGSSEKDRSESSQVYHMLLGHNEKLKLEIIKLVGGITAREAATQKGVVIHQNKNRTMIEECNKLIEENDSFDKLLKQMTELIKDGYATKALVTSKLKNETEKLPPINQKS